MVEEVRLLCLDSDGVGQVHVDVAYLRGEVAVYSVDDAGVNLLLDEVLASAKGRLL